MRGGVNKRNFPPAFLPTAHMLESPSPSVRWAIVLRLAIAPTIVDMFIVFRFTVSLASETSLTRSDPLHPLLQISPSVLFGILLSLTCSICISCSRPFSLAVFPNINIETRPHPSLSTSTVLYR